MTEANFPLKIGRHTYTITESDRFLDNGASVQLTTQSKEPTHWRRAPNPVLSKRAIKEIAKFERRRHKHRHPSEFEFFSLRMVTWAPPA